MLCKEKHLPGVLGQPRGTALGMEAKLSPRCPVQRGLSCPPALELWLV